MQTPTTFRKTTQESRNDLDILWNPSSVTQAMLPVTPFGANFPSTESPQNVQFPQIESFSQFSSRLPPLDNVEDVAEDDNEAESIASNYTVPWSISVPCYERFYREVQSYSEVLPTECSLPSRNTLAMYLEKYLRCIQEFLPFTHTATFSVEQANIELLLAMAALGSLYRFEILKSYELYFLAKAILSEKARREDLHLMSDFFSGQSRAASSNKSKLGRIQTFILLIDFASWGDKKILSDSLSMGGQLAMLVRENGISESDKMPQDADWLSWVAIEERRRTLLAAYMVLNLHNIAFDIPPLILNHEVGVFLPGFAEQWKSKSAAEWIQLPCQVERRFQDGLQSLFNATRIPKEESVSSFSSYLLIHGLLQQMYIEQHSIGSLDTVNSFEIALRTWQVSWELAYESTLDPSSPKGPFGLTATALLRLAYIRLNSNLRPCRGLLSRDIQCVTDEGTTLERSPHVGRAVLHAAHALSIPVRQGIAFLALTKTPLWNIDHSLCSLECTLLLKNWLEMISTITRSCGIEGLREDERRLLEIISEIINETSFAKTPEILEQDDASRIQQMAIVVVKLWAQIFQGAHIFDVDNFVGASLQHLADIQSEL